MFEKICQELQSYDTIIIHRHNNPTETHWAARSV